ncbi:MAG TPA: MarR family winged helix-turn-helix transcriptional regulator [Dongiaceae bacterium]|nr:MarR family winged helix-turn-helix transcriptional regulator [Dongiaceae bacterium]
MTKGAASKVITKLESKGLAQRRLAEDKAREQVLRLTSAGRQLVPKLARSADDNDDFFFGHLKTAERAALMTQMKELILHHQLKEIPVK